MMVVPVVWGSVAQTSDIFCGVVIFFIYTPVRVVADV